MLLLQTVIFSLFKSLEAFNELSWDDVYKMFWINRFVFFDLAVTNPSNLLTCNTGVATYNFDLTTNNEAALGIDTAIYDVFYYETPADIVANNPIPAGNLVSYPSAGGQTIYIKIFNTITGNFCDAEYTFDLIVTNAVVATQPNPVSVCEGQGSTTYSFSATTIVSH